MSRVLSTDEAKQAITKMQQLINGPLLEQISALNKEGQTLSRSDVWDGQLASQFRSEWPQTHNTLKNVQTQLEELRRSIEKINQNIMTAGGNS